MNGSDRIIPPMFSDLRDKYVCPKCRSENIVISGDLTVYANSGTVDSVETVKYLACKDCKFSEEWIPEDGDPIFSDLEKEWIVKGGNN